MATPAKKRAAPPVRQRSRISVRAVDPAQHLFSLTRMQRECFPRDTFMPLNSGFWVMAFVNQIQPIGFALMIPEDEKTGVIERVGVMPGHRGHRLQIRLLNRCEAEARKLGWDMLLATTYNNPAAANNFIYARWTQYEPEDPWCAPGTDYWMAYIEGRR